MHELGLYTLVRSNDRIWSDWKYRLVYCLLFFYTWHEYKYLGQEFRIYLIETM